MIGVTNAKIVTGGSGGDNNYVLIDSYKSGTSWYKVFEEYDPDNGNYVGKWCEQGGRSDQKEGTVYLGQAYSNTDYKVFVQQNGSDGAYLNRCQTVSQKTSNSFWIDYKTLDPSGSGTFTYYDWKAEGYITEE